MKLTPIRILTVLAALALSATVSAQTISVSGQVTDATTGEPVIGAGVVVSGGAGTVTDYDGKYTIKAADNATITFSSLGYKTVTEKVNGRSVIDVVLPTDDQLLEEVVVLGYTTQKKAELSSAVVSVSGEKLTDITTPDVGNMLQGKVAGVMVMNSSGQPGAGADIRIRGTGSITAGAGPLYVVDGVAGGSFNPNDIETLTVLKDASATALYGAAASGGVIVITTKSAKQDKAIIDFKASAGIKRALSGRFKPMDSFEMYDFCKQLYTTKTQLRANAPAEEDLEKMNFNWIDNTFKTGIVQNYYASVSGKAGKVGYYVSLDHYNEQGSLINSGYVRTAARVNLSAPITERLNMNVRLNYSKDQTNSARWRTREKSYIMMPFDIPYVMDEDGNYTDEPIKITTGRRPDNGKTWYSKEQINIYYNELYNYARSYGESLTGDIQLIWNVTDWLTLTSTNRYDSSNSFSEEYFDPRTTEVADSKGELDQSLWQGSGWGTTDLAKFHKTFGDHDVNAIVGWEYGEGFYRSMSASGDQFPAGMRSLSTSIMKSIGGNDYQTRSWALLSQAQYSYLGKYIVTASLRYDESYKFGPLNRGGFFPGASAAWVITNEDFMKNAKDITFLKLRAGYGKTGNDNIPAFRYQDTFSLTAQYNKIISAFLERQANYNLGWEEAYMASLGIDATIANNWNITLDAYHTINDRLLLEQPQAPSTGFFSVMANVGKVRNMGVELAADGAIIKTRDFRWDFGFNVGANKNTVLELPDHKDMPLSAGDVTQMVIEGNEIYSWYMPKWAGVDYETGKPLWEHLEYDENGNVTETILTSSYSEATYQIVGSASPWLTGGLNTGLSWKGFSLSATGSFVLGNKIYNRTRWGIMDTDGAQQQFNQQSLNNGLGWIRWKEGDPDGTNIKATHPQAIKGGNSGAHNYSSRYLEDGSFFRLRNVTLSYSLPSNILEKVKMGGARVYVSADNLWTYTRFSGMDPEVNLVMDTYSLPGTYSDNYPVPMSVVMGIELKF
ncbi:MAG: TonB-dependent receptor [Bacteroidales bacterium]|nr:TonB-dependent receptor [Bacteroidales bacterium]